jgi:muconolactone delta-isomerase
MEYLVTMTMHVPDGNPAEAVDDVRASEAARYAAGAAERLPTASHRHRHVLQRCPFDNARPVRC